MKDKTINNALADAKKKLVAELLTPEEVQQVSGGVDSATPHWKEFTKFVMASDPM